MSLKVKVREIIWLCHSQVVQAEILEWSEHQVWLF